MNGYQGSLTITLLRSCLKEDIISRKQCVPLLGIYKCNPNKEKKSPAFDDPGSRSHLAAAQETQQS